MHALRISFIFLLFFMTFSCHAESLYSKLYQESIRPLYKSIRIRDVIIKQRLLLLPSRWRGREDNLNQNLHAFSGYFNRKWKANKNELNKKPRFFQTNKIHPNPDTANRRQVVREHSQGSNLPLQLNQEIHIRKLDHDPQQDQNSVQAQISGNFSCIIPKWVNQSEIGKSLPIPYPNPCQPDPKRQCEFIYEKYTVKEEFIQCDKSGKALLKSCLYNSQWDNTLKSCLYSYISSNASCTIPSWDNQNETGSNLPGYYANPCEADRKRICDYIYQRYKMDSNKFIRCDRSGNAVLKSCPSSAKWDKKFKRCSLKTTMAMTSTEQSTESKTTKYTVPSTTEMATKQTNKITTEEPGTTAISSEATRIETTSWLTTTIPESTKQSIITTPTAETPTTKTLTTLPTSHSAADVTSKAASMSSIYMTTETMLPCIVPSWDNQNSNGMELEHYLINPCRPQPNSNCKFTYKLYYLDPRKFIQCDRSGNARVKSCPTSFTWDNSSHQCISETLNTTQLPCIVPSWDNQNDNGTELEHYLINPCRPQPNSNCKFTYKLYYMDPHKFIQCDRSGNARVKSCPTSFTWDNSSHQCISETLSTTQLPCIVPSWDNQNDNGTELEHYLINPCRPQPNSNCKFTYKLYYMDPLKFIQCDRSGNARVKSCPTSFTWDNSSHQCISETLSTTQLPCIVPSWDNQNDNGTELEHYLINPCRPQPNSNCKFTYKLYYMDPHKFIQCDRSGNARVKSCPTSFTWDNSSHQCISETLSTTQLPCIVPSWDNQNDNGTELEHYLINPCRPQPNSNCKFTYKLYYMDPHKFIQCDRSGNARVKSCPTSFTWDNSSHQCISETLSTTQLPCIVPSWDNQNDNGTELEHYLINPCRPQPNSNCKFTYKLYYMDPLKFIQCDRSGNARVKSCPTSFTWDNSSHQCISETLSTTQLPCIVPSWDNQNDNGTELEHYLINPCRPQPNSNCKFTYKLYYMDPLKFIQCDRSGNARVKSCPTSFTWDKDVHQCLPEVLTTEQVLCLIPSGVDETLNISILPSFYPNPCHVDMSRPCEFAFKPFLLDPHKFIQCDKLGKASVKLCRQYFNWSQTMQRCLPEVYTTIKPHCQIPTWVNQNELGSLLPTYYPNPCIADADRACLFVYKPFLLDQNKFIVCDKTGDALIKTCPPNSEWIDNAGKCSIPNIQTTTKSECDVPVWVNQNEQGMPLKPFYPNPCPIDSTRKCEFIYVIYILDQHKFIQCNRSGKAVLKSCPLNSIWDNTIKQCSIQTTIRPPCTVPIWVNPNDKGLSLPSYIPNPCKTTPIQTCKYFNYVINDSSFIECDQYGEAWVKTCPSLSKWNNTFKMCTKISNK